MYNRNLGSFPGPRPTLPAMPTLPSISSLPNIPILQQNVPIMPIYPSAPLIIQNPTVYRFNSNFQNPLHVMPSRMPRPFPVATNFSQNFSSISQNSSQSSLQSQVHSTSLASNTVDSSSQTEDDIHLSKVNVKNDLKVKNDLQFFPKHF